MTLPRIRRLERTRGRADIRPRGRHSNLQWSCPRKWSSFREWHGGKSWAASLGLRPNLPTPKYLKNTGSKLLIWPTNVHKSLVNCSEATRLKRRFSIRKVVNKSHNKKSRVGAKKLLRVISLRDDLTNLFAWIEAAMTQTTNSNVASSQKVTKSTLLLFLSLLFPGHLLIISDT
jgi:hypothetical protein